MEWSGSWFDVNEPVAKANLLRVCEYNRIDTDQYERFFCIALAARKVYIQIYESKGVIIPTPAMNKLVKTELTSKGQKDEIRIVQLLNSDPEPILNNVSF